MGVANGTVNLNFVQQLSPGAGFSQRGLRDDFTGVSTLGIKRGHLVALGKSALAEVLASLVPTGGCGWSKRTET